jgi:hypothetical protein
MGVYVTFYLLESQGTSKKKRSWCFVKKRIKKTTLEHPFSFPLLPLFMPFFFFTTILRKNNFNIQVILENQAMISMW